MNYTYEYFGPGVGIYQRVYEHLKSISKEHIYDRYYGAKLSKARSLLNRHEISLPIGFGSFVEKLSGPDYCDVDT
jgi:hypothetical protein